MREEGTGEKYPYLRYLPLSMSQEFSSMDGYLPVQTFLNRDLADAVCSALEEEQVSLMLEHVYIGDQEEEQSAYRLLVPQSQFQTALFFAARLTHRYAERGYAETQLRAQIANG